jgi:stage V sporulation protein G
MTKKTISEIQIIPIKPTNGLIGFASFVLFESLYCSSVGIITRPNGGYRLLYPTKKVSEKNISIYYPINKEVGLFIEEKVIEKLQDVMKRSNDRHNSNNTL